MKKEKEYHDVMEKIGKIIIKSKLNSLETLGVLEAIKVSVALASIPDIKVEVE